MQVTLDRNDIEDLVRIINEGNFRGFQVERVVELKTKLLNPIQDFNHEAQSALDATYNGDTEPSV